MNIIIRRLVGLAVALTLAGLGWGVYLQAQHTLAPVERRQFFDNNGDPLSGGLVYTYVAGTSTSAVTYSDSGGTQAANPIVLDSAGRAPIYLAAASYKFIVADSALVPLYTQDNIQSVASAAAQATITNVCDGRLTLTSATPVTTTDVTGATTVYFTPYHGTRCALYDGTTWNIRTFSELSLALGSDASDTNYDLFAWDSGGVVTLQRRAWSGQNTRTTDLTLQDGVYVRLGATTARYLGSYRTSSVAGQIRNTFQFRYVYNWLHPVTQPVRRHEDEASWAYSTATFRLAKGNTQNVIEVLAGQPGGALDLTVLGSAENTGTAANIDVAIGEDSSITPVTGCLQGRQRISQANVVYQVTSPCSIYVAVGYHTYQWLEQSAASGTTTWFGTGGGATRFGGMTGTWTER